MGDMQFDVDECIEYWCAELCWHNSSIFKYDKYKEQKHFSKNRGGGRRQKLPAPETLMCLTVFL